RWDGRGYPDRRPGSDIPIAARVFAVADALDAMTSDRPYRGAMRWHDAGREILSQSGSQFDPDVVRAFRSRERNLRKIHRDFSFRRPRPALALGLTVGAAWLPEPVWCQRTILPPTTLKNA